MVLSSFVFHWIRNGTLCGFTFDQMLNGALLFYIWSNDKWCSPVLAPACHVAFCSPPPCPAPFFHRGHNSSFSFCRSVHLHDLMYLWSPCCTLPTFFTSGHNSSFSLAGFVLLLHSLLYQIQIQCICTNVCDAEPCWILVTCTIRSWFIGSSCSTLEYLWTLVHLAVHLHTFHRSVYFHNLM